MTVFTLAGKNVNIRKEIRRERWHHIWIHTVRLKQAGTCGPRDHLIRPASEFSCPKLEYVIASKQNCKKTRYADDKSIGAFSSHSPQEDNRRVVA